MIVSKLEKKLQFSYVVQFKHSMSIAQQLSGKINQKTQIEYFKINIFFLNLQSVWSIFVFLVLSVTFLYHDILKLSVYQIVWNIQLVSCMIKYYYPVC